MGRDAIIEFTVEGEVHDHFRDGVHRGQDSTLRNCFSKPEGFRLAMRLFPHSFLHRHFVE
jgi:hypothetical protein